MNPLHRHSCRGFRRRQHERRGASVVEFALVAPVFFMLMIGIIEVGRALMIQQVLINASRVGARQAALLNTTSTAVTGAVATYASGAGGQRRGDDGLARSWHGRRRDLDHGDHVDQFCGGQLDSVAVVYGGQNH